MLRGVFEAAISDSSPKTLIPCTQVSNDKNEVFPSILFSLVFLSFVSVLNIFTIECVRTCDQKPFLHNEQKEGFA